MCMLTAHLVSQLRRVCRYFMEHAPTVTLSYAFVHPEGIERPWSRSVKPMALALAKTANRTPGRKLLASPVVLRGANGGISIRRA